MELFCRGFILEGFSLLRSAIETAIYIQYLRLYPKEKTEYINSSRLFNVKNSFIILKGMFSTGDEHHYGKHTPFRLFLDRELTNIIITNPKKFVGFPSEIPEILTKEEVESFDSFFRSLEFPTQKFFHLLKKIQKKKDISQFRDMLAEFYDVDSSTLHGNYIHWKSSLSLNGFNLTKIMDQVAFVFDFVMLAMDDVIEDFWKKYYYEQVKKGLIKEKEIKEKIPPTAWSCSGFF